MSFISEIVGAVETEAATVENKAVAVVQWVEAEVDSAAGAVVNSVLLPLWKSLAPAIITTAEPLMSKVIEDAGVIAIDYFTGRPIESAVTDLLNAAEALGVAEIKAIEPLALQAYVAIKAIGAKLEADVAAVL